MTTTYNAVSLATAFAARHGLSDTDKTALHRALRNMVDSDVLPSEVDEDSGRAPRIFPVEVAAVGLVLFPLTRMAVDARLLRKVAGYLLSPGFGGVQPISRALSAVSEGRQVELVVTLSSDWQVGFALRVEGEEATGEAAEILKAGRAANPPAAEILVPVNLWAAPLLDA